MSVELFEKYDELKSLIKKYTTVGVAFSGGIDSSLLVLIAVKVLGAENVVALHGRSVLSCDESAVTKTFHQNFHSSVELKVIELNPLTWPEFVSNDDKRCYFCKRKTYTAFKKHLCGVGVETLLDGTNFDDLYSNRAGLPVLDELDIKTPLAEAGFRKKEIRFLAKILGLQNYNLPSDSCLATRLQSLPSIDNESLFVVKNLETYIKNIGFKGCRVKPDKSSVVIELRQQDIVKFSHKHNRLNILKICRRFGFSTVYLDIQGRL
ncbi:MAG: ATP-dependent sacrificial sulfur transferase LarE [Desulfopila sp.]|jgi:uncharacterized protein|nr:ATP-dependent sacrificial sulfur transferase LarE [Desulfopila sp.]